MPKDAPSAYGDIPQEPSGAGGTDKLCNVGINEFYFLEQRLEAIQKLLEKILDRIDTSV